MQNHLPRGLLTRHCLPASVPDLCFPSAVLSCCTGHAGLPGLRAASKQAIVSLRGLSATCAQRRVVAVLVSDAQALAARQAARVSPVHVHSACAAPSAARRQAAVASVLACTAQCRAQVLNSQHIHAGFAARGLCSGSSAPRASRRASAAVRTAANAKVRSAPAWPCPCGEDARKGSVLGRRGFAALGECQAPPRASACGLGVSASSVLGRRGFAAQGGEQARSSSVARGAGVSAGGVARQRGRQGQQRSADQVPYSGSNTRL